MTRRAALVVLVACGGGGTPSPPGDAPGPDADTRTFTLREVGRVPLDGPVDFAIVGDRLYAQASGVELLVAFSLADPTTPSRIGGFPEPTTGGSNGRVAISGDLAFLAFESSGLVIVDIADPSAPILRGTFPQAYAKDVSIVGTVAYVADQGSGS
jgi:hypothetical protein